MNVSNCKSICFLSGYPVIFCAVFLNLPFQDLPFMCMGIPETHTPCDSNTHQKNPRYVQNISPLFPGQKCVFFVQICFFLILFCQVQPGFAPHRLNCSKIDCQRFILHSKLFCQCIESETAASNPIVQFAQKRLIYPAADGSPDTD